MPSVFIPVSAVVATKDRAESLARTLSSLAAQGTLPRELVVVDGSTGEDSRKLVENWGKGAGNGCLVCWQRAEQLGAACQRNQGVAVSGQPFIWFFDDDVVFEPNCAERLWRAIQDDHRLGGVNAMIVNQKYHPPGVVSRVLFTLLNGRRELSFAGRVIGPAVNLLPEDKDDLPAVIAVEWLNTTCTIYRREALPAPVFDSVFTGYSMMEDLALSLKVGLKWKLANARTARIFHDSQPGSHKADPMAITRMEIINRHYIMTRVLLRNRVADYIRLLIWEVFQLAVCAFSGESRPKFWATCLGKWRGLREIRLQLQSPAGGVYSGSGSQKGA